jgi:hypothetical protein
MNPATKNDINAAAQQIINAISNKTVSYQDANNIAQGAAQRLCTKQDLITILNSMRDNFVERVSAPLREQQAATRSLLTQIDSMQHRMAQLESKLEEAHAIMQSLSRNNQSNSNQSDPPQSVFQEYYYQR